MTNLKKSSSNDESLSTLEALAIFEKAAKEFTSKNGKSKNAARSAMVRLGIHTDKGNLRAPYK